MRVEGFDHVALNVRSLDSAVSFYEGVLGLERDERPDMGLPGAWYRVGESQLHIIEVPEGVDVGRVSEALNPIAAHLAIRVADFESARDEFSSRGIEIFQLGPESDQFWVRDSDGNTVEVTRL